MPFPPSLFLIGAQKSGSTYLANLLSQHPDICLCEPKEPEFFTRHTNKGLDWYKNKFSDIDAKILMDATTSYSSKPIVGLDDLELETCIPVTGVPGRIHAVSPKAKFIYMLREPISRTYSSYWHNVRAGNENLGFSDALHSTTAYMRMSHYHEQISAYLEYFNRSSILILLFEDFISDPQATAEKCFHFLGLQSINLSLEVGTNASFQYAPFLNRLNQYLPSSDSLGAIIQLIKPLIPESLFNFVGKKTTAKIPPIGYDDKTYLMEYFRDMNKLLEKDFNLDLTRWR